MPPRSRTAHLSRRAPHADEDLSPLTDSAERSEGTSPAVHTWTQTTLGNSTASRVLLEGPDNPFEAAIASTWADHHAGRDASQPGGSNTGMQALCHRTEAEPLVVPDISLTGGTPLPARAGTDLREVEFKSESVLSPSSCSSAL